MSNKNLNLKEQRINEMLTENFKYPGLTPDFTPDGFEDDCIPLEQFLEEGRTLITQKMKKLYGNNT